MAESEPSGEARVDGPVRPDDGPFDAFNATTWNFERPRLPWYRTRQSVIAMVAVSVAAIAIVVSLALLASRGPSDDSRPPAPETATTTTTTTSATTSATTLPPRPSGRP